MPSNSGLVRGYSTVFQPMCGTFTPPGSRSHVPGTRPSPSPLAVLEPDVGEQLQPEADAEERRALGDRVAAARPRSAALAQVRRRVAKRADAGQHDAVGALDRPPGRR